MVEDKKQDNKECSLVEVPTQTTVAFKLEDESLVDDKGMLLAIYKILKKLEKGLL